MENKDKRRGKEKERSEKRKINGRVAEKKTRKERGKRNRSMKTNGHERKEKRRQKDKEESEKRDGGLWKKTKDKEEEKGIAA